MAEKKTYGPKEVSELTGISRRQLNYWKLIGVVKPRRVTHRTRVFYRYAERDLEILKAVRKLTLDGYPVSIAAERIKPVLKDLDGNPGVLVTQLEASPTSRITAMDYFMRRLREEFGRAKRFSYSFSCLAIKVTIPQAGPEGHEPIFNKIEAALLSSKRDYDVVARMDSGEFLWLLPQTGESEAKAASDRIGQLLKGQGLPEDVTIEIGASTVQSGSGTPESLIDQARRACLEPGYEKLGKEG